MKNSFKLIALVLLAYTFHSGTQTVYAFASKKTDGKSSAEDSGSFVWVMKPDGGESCAKDSAISIEQGAEDLKKAKIKILASQKGDDGKMHAQMCGLPTGKLNLYKINKSDLPRAVTLGFEESASK